MARINRVSLEDCQTGGGNYEVELEGYAVDVSGKYEVKSSKVSHITSDNHDSTQEYTSVNAVTEFVANTYEGFVTEYSEATDNTQVAYKTVDDEIEVPSMEEFNALVNRFEALEALVNAGN